MITTLILATTFTPIKRRLEAIVERRITPDAGPTTHGDPAAVDEHHARGGVAATAPTWLDDPAFVTAVRDQIRIVLAERPDDAGGSVPAHDDQDATAS